MPWNDSANGGSDPGPWGAPPPAGGKDGRGSDGRGPEGRGSEGRGSGGDRGGKGEGVKRPIPLRPRQGGGGGGGGRRPSLNTGELDAGLRNLAERFRGFLYGGGRSPRPRAVLTLVGIAAGLWLLTGVYVVQPDQQAVVTRFGSVVGTAGPGLRFHIPAPIERAQRVSVTTLQRMDVGGLNTGDTPEESLMLTGDENIVDLNFTVIWRVADPVRYLFNARDPDGAVKAAAESAMREVVGQTALQPLLTTARGQVQARAAELMQRILDGYGAGVSVVEVQIRNSQPPQQVIGAFREVANANQDAEAAVNVANSYRNRVVNEAKGDASRIRQSAEAYREQVVREATGEAARFRSLQAEASQSPAATRQRLYLETMERVLGRANTVVVDSRGASAPVILPPDVFRPRTQAPTAPTPEALDQAAVQQQSDARAAAAAAQQGATR